MRSRLAILLAVLGGLAVVALWWPTAVVSGSVPALATAVAELAGMVGSYLVCIQVLLVRSDGRVSSDAVRGCAG